MSKFVSNSFYCIKCGNRSMELPRQRSHQHSKHHRKRLWCPYCKIEINHIECKNEDDIYEFKMKYLDGDYIEEAQESITFCG